MELAFLIIILKPGGAETERFQQQIPAMGRKASEH